MSWLWLALLIVRGAAVMLASPDNVAPSIVFIGDPHLNFQTAADVWIAQTNWIAANVSTWNVKAVVCAGDFDGGTINGPADPTANITDGWNHGWNTIDGTGLPYLMAVGNHDYANNQPSTRDTTVFDAQLGYSRINGKSWYGGFYDDGATSKANQYILVTVGTHNLLIMALELFPRPEAMAWADGVILAHLDREVIIITHGYMHDAALFNWFDGSGPSTYNLPQTVYGGDTLATWAQKWPNNVRLVICGHWNSPSYFRRADGRTYGILSDYQQSATPSQVILIIAFSTNSVTVNNYNTTTQTLDVTTFPPDTFVWPLPPAKPTYTLAQ